uniref:RGS domain-containing protein n=1 Tax=Felis catus TaxID=9685 RepID=A0ABI7Y173_FELCA
MQIFTRPWKMKEAPRLCVMSSSQTRPLPRSCSTCFLARSLASRDSSLTFSSDPLLGLPSGTRTSPSCFPLAPCRRLGSRGGTGSGQAASRSCSGQLWHCLGPQGDACPRKRMPARGRARPCPLTVRNQEEQRPRRASHELRREDLPTCEESPSPTLEEVSAWAQSFDKVMLTPAGRNAFREFLRTEFSEENMLFWMACEELKKEANKTVIEEKARTIYEDYISILSPKEVSLDSRVREVINRNMGEPSQHIFDDAQLQIYTLMHRDSYPRFMNSALYKDLLQSLSEKSVEA